MATPTLSILICTLEERRQTFERLLQQLQPQVAGQPVEILQLCDNRQLSIGKKRQQLLEQAQGQYVAFIDDDDEVTPNYVQLILTALQKLPQATHCSLLGLLTARGWPDRTFEHSTRYKIWEERNGIFVRPPNHLNTIRRDLALQAGFVDSNWGEDRQFSERLVALGCLTKEAAVPSVLYYYRCRRPPPPPRPKQQPKPQQRKPIVPPVNIRLLQQKVIGKSERAPIRPIIKPRPPNSP